MLLIIDLFCGAGGAAMGLHQALEEHGIEHEIWGIDIRDLENIYPFHFIQGNVFDFPIEFYQLFDFFHASPPCQGFSFASIRNRHIYGLKYPDLIAPTRNLLNKIGKPHVIENVIGAPLRKDLVLCGVMFNLGVFRHRVFEINGFVAYQPRHPKHEGKIGDGKYFCVITGSCHSYEKKQSFNKELWKAAMGIDWIKTPKTKRLPSRHPLAEAIPPAYTKYIMNQFLKKYVNLDYFIDKNREGII